VFKAGLPTNCPIVNTNPDNLKQNLIALLQDPQLRHNIGKESRAFAEQYHDVEKIAKDLAIVYQNALKIK
jgi:glycosyltransferase involved in cell wall biosynthesis